MSDEEALPKRRRTVKRTPAAPNAVEAATARPPLSHEATTLVAVVARLATRAAALGCEPLDVTEAVIAAMTNGDPTPVESLTEQRTIEVRLLRGDVPVPGYKTDGAIAWDLCHVGPEPLVIRPGRKSMAESGVCIHIPDPDIGAFLGSSSFGVGRVAFAITPDDDVRPFGRSPAQPYLPGRNGTGLPPVDVRSS